MTRRPAVPMARQPSPRPTMADVARHAGVSPATVSFVVNGRKERGISESTRQRVLEAIAALGYRPNRHARGLRTNSSSTIGFVTDDLAVHVAGLMIVGVHDVGRSYGSVPLIGHATNDELQQVVEDLLDRQIDALAYAVAGTRPVDVIAAFHIVPTVLVNGFSVDHTLPCVLPAESAGGRAAARELLAAGHRELAYITGFGEVWATGERLRGVRGALRAAGLDAASMPVLEGNFRSDSGHELTSRLLAGRRRPTGLLCGNDLMAVGAYLAIKEAGLQIPDEISVVGYDDQPDIAPFIVPALTTVRLPYYEMGATATRNLLDGRSSTPSRTFEPCPVVRRASVAPPPRRPR